MKRLLEEAGGIISHTYVYLINSMVIPLSKIEKGTIQKYKLQYSLTQGNNATT